jgi:uncharacterized membrane protein (UPF0127 family)
LRNLLVAFLAYLLLVVPSAWAQTADAERKELIISTGSGERTFAVEIADDPRERARGLMFRRHMDSGHGMLFDFQEEERASFWMENTYIPLDMLFIKADGTVESIAARTTPLSRRSVVSKGPIRYVLEINGGLSQLLGIKPGDKVSGPAIGARQ